MYAHPAFSGTALFRRSALPTAGFRKAQLAYWMRSAFLRGLVKKLLAGLDQFWQIKCVNKEALSETAIGLVFERTLNGSSTT